ncbi:MAG: hypothetical protein LBD16_01065 [Oscillospiraceae bacterium]|jgi:hypothetical protein|nr:hypothetical protein [Oscillospiraceae bacterium]
MRRNEADSRKQIIDIEFANVKRFIDDDLSALEFTAGNEAQILSRIKKEPVMKRKLSLSFAVITALLLIVTAAIAAAIISGKQFAEDIIAPIISNTESEAFTPEEITEIRALTEEAGIVLPDDVIAGLEDDYVDIEYKEELLRVIVKTELGFYPGAWSIEDQAWYNELCVKYGLQDRVYLFVPEGDEISFDTAIGIAQTRIKDEYGDDTDLNDKNLYIQFQQYYAYTEDDGNEMPRSWILEYSPLDVNLNYYVVRMTSSGEITETKKLAGVRDALTFGDISERYNDVYNNYFTWDFSTWVDYHNDMRAFAESSGTSVYANIYAAQEFADPKEDLLAGKIITQEAAAQLAREAVSDDAGIPIDEMDKFYTPYVLYMTGSNGPVWKVRLNCSWENARNGEFVHWAEIDAVTSEIISVDYRDESNAIRESYVLRETVVKCDEYLEAHPTPESFG